MSQIYITSQNDMLDTICYQHYGRVDVLPQVLLANTGLAEQPEKLRAGMRIQLPAISKPDTSKEAINLWN